MSEIKLVLYSLIIVTLILVPGHIKTDEDLEDEIPFNPEDLDVSTTHYNKDGKHYVDYDHEMILGSYQDAEDFKELGPEEAKKRLGIMFDKMDEDKNGNLSKAELVEWITQSLNKLDAEGLIQEFNETDTNQDQNVTFSEYLSKSYGHTEQQMGDMMNSTKEWNAFLLRINVDKERFNLADKNNNRLLDFNEFIKFNNPDNYKEMALYTLNRTLTFIDKNNDRLIDLEEFLGEEDLDNETQSYETSIFKENDKDHNGSLNETEIIEWKTPGFAKTAQIEVEHLFNRTDANQDKQLSKKEVIDQHELWVGSHANDYGRHLDEVKPHEEL